MAGRRLQVRFHDPTKILRPFADDRDQPLARKFNATVVYPPILLRLSPFWLYLGTPEQTGTSLGVMSVDDERFACRPRPFRHHPQAGKSGRRDEIASPHEAPIYL